MKTMPLPETEDRNDATAQDMPELNMPVRRKLPTGIASNVKQHVLVVCDHSTSMSGAKLNELNMARDALIAELANPENKDGFRVTVVDFSGLATRIRFAEPAVGLTVPPSVAAGGTDFNAALRETLSAIRDFKALPNSDGWRYLRPVVLFLSDGQAAIDGALLAEVREEAQVIAIAYGDDADRKTLGRIASDGTVQVVGTDGDELRQFLAAVGQTMSETLQDARL